MNLGDIKRIGVSNYGADVEIVLDVFYRDL
jgi:hypothetical protein